MASDLDLLDQVLELTVVLGADMTSSLARDGLTVSRAHLLWVLQQAGPVTQRQLAEALGVSARNVTGLVDGLAQTGFVTREPHPTDRRATLVQFTERGAAITAELDRGKGELAALLFADLPDEVRAGMAEGLRHVLTQLHERLGADRPENRNA